MFFKRDLVLGQEYLAFLILNLLDLFLTGWMFRNHALEANGLAAWILAHFGARDFALFKFLMVIFIILICERIAISDIPRARFVILLGCAVYFLVICYEAYLIATTAPVIHAPEASIPAASPLECRPEWFYAPQPAADPLRVVPHAA